MGDKRNGHFFLPCKKVLAMAATVLSCCSGKATARVDLWVWAIEVVTRIGGSLFVAKFFDEKGVEKIVKNKKIRALLDGMQSHCMPSINHIGSELQISPLAKVHADSI